jgi:hypothetical protein
VLLVHARVGLVEHLIVVDGTGLGGLLEDVLLKGGSLGVCLGRSVCAVGLGVMGLSSLGLVLAVESSHLLSLVDEGSHCVWYIGAVEGCMFEEVCDD